MADDTKSKIREFAYQAMDSLTASLIIDDYDAGSAKYCGTVLCVFDSSKGSHNLWFLSFERIDKNDDITKRAHIREVLADYGLEKFFDEEVSCLELVLFSLKLAFFGLRLAFFGLRLAF